MPVSVCDPVRAALRDSLSAGDDQLHLERQLMTSAKRVLITRIEYEEAPNYNSSVLEALKFKCVVLNANKPSTEDKNMPAAKSPGSEGLPSPKRILFTQEAVQLGWSSSNQHKWAVGAGMNNVGNTCYLNSTLQALFHVPALANWLVSDDQHRDRCEETSGSQGGCIICAMSKTLLASQSNSGAITPWLVYSKLRFVCRHMVPGRQEDAHEFLRYLVEAMEKAFLARIKNSRELDQYSKETTPLNRILGGYVRTAVRCLSCGYVSTTFQHFQDLLLDIRKASTVDEALAGYFARERLEDMGYRCESCKSMVSATKQFSLEKAPNVLCIQLKRFSMMGSKLNKHVYFNARLDLSQFASKPSSEPLTYQLVSLVTHLGSSQHCGHYTAIGMAEGGTYYQFDDSCVRSLSLQSVLSTNAYIIIYELERPKSALTKQTHNMNNDVVKYPTVPNDPSLSRLALTMPPKRPVDTAPVTVLSKSSPSASPGKICFSISPKKPEPVSSPKGSGFIGPIQPPPNHLGSKLVITSNKPEYITNGTENKFLNTGSKLILTSPKPVMNGPKPVQSDNQSSSNGNPNGLPRLQVNGKKMTNGMVKPVKEPQSVKPLTVNGLKINGVNGTKDNNCCIGPVRGLVPYSLDDSDESSSENIVKPVITSEREQLVNTKAAVAGWKVTTSASSPSLQGKAGWSSKTQEIKVIEEPVQKVLNGHMTYAAPVMSWTGNRAYMDREVEQERREDRKRAYDSTDYMDCGRTKKIKVYVERERFNPGYNPFQETHNARRWRSHNDKQYYDNYRRYNAPQRNNSYNGGYKGSRHRGGFHNHAVRTHVQRDYNR